MKPSKSTQSISLLLAFSSVFTSTIAIGQDKIALVIGNAKYKDAPLKNPVNDANDIKTALEKSGFTVIYAENADIDKMDEMTDKFLNALDRDALGVFFYSGHGIQASGVNYLIPIGSKITNEATLKRQSYDVNTLVSQLQSIGNPSNILILDACRDNPYEQKAGTKSFANVSKGLAEIKTTADAGLLIAYATASGKTASDNQKEKNGLYTKYLKQYLFQSGLTVEAALKKVRQSVVKENPEQIPWDNSSLLEDVCLAGCEASPTITQPTGTPPSIALVSGADSVVKNKTYTIKFKASDADGDLSRIEVVWGDGTANSSKAATNGATLTFTHTYKFAGIQSLVASAIDDTQSSSEFSKSVDVKNTTTPAEKIPNVSNANASPSSIIVGNAAAFSAKLSAALPTGYTVKINYGDGLKTMTADSSKKAFSFSASPTELGSNLFTVGIYDSKNALKSNLLTGNFSVAEPEIVAEIPVEPVVVETPKTTKGDVETFTSGDKTFSYTKIANDGSELSKDAKLGTGAKDWACTKDNNTGLIWEVKTDDGGLRDKDWHYSWYEPDASKNGGFEGYKNNSYYNDTSICKGSECDTYAFTNAVNKQGLCGVKDWRMPSKDELMQLVSCSDGKYDSDDGECTNYNSVTRPTINTTYFPNTPQVWFWSASVYADYTNHAWVVDFFNGHDYSDSKNAFNAVRLVRGGQSF